MLPAFALIVQTVAQKPPEIHLPDTPECVSCVIEFDHVVRLGSTDGPDFIAADLLAISGRAGGPIFVLPAMDGAALVFDDAGRFMRPLGPQGQGPGEYLRPAFVLPLRNGEALVFDARQGRITTLDSTLRVVSTTPLVAAVSDAIELADGGLVVNAQVPTPERFGLPLHLMDPTTGAIQVSFGEPAADVIRDPGQLARLIVPGPDGGTWSIRRYEYLLEQFDSAGRLLQSVRRDPPWFPEVSRVSLGDATHPPDARFKAARIDSVGRIWLAAWVPSNAWREAWKGIEVRPDGHYQPPPYNELFSSRIDVVDPQRGLIASQAWRGVPISWVGDGLLATTLQDTSGVIYVDLWRVRLTQRPGEPGT